MKVLPSVRPVEAPDDVERAVLGSILLDPSQLSAVADLVGPDDFYRENHAEVYRALLALRAAGTPIDNVTLAGELEERKTLNRIGGRVEIAELMEAVPTAANAVAYADQVAERARDRRFEATVQRLVSVSNDPLLTAAEKWQRTDEIVAAQRYDLSVASSRRLFLSVSDLLTALEETQAEMIAGPYIRRGTLANVTGRVKYGKSTLLWAMVSALTTGGLFLGHRCIASKVFYASEERWPSLREALRRAGIGADNENLRVSTLSERGSDPWDAYVAKVVREAEEFEADVLVFDTVPKLAFLKDEQENAAGVANTTMLALERAAAKGFAVVAVFHLGKTSDTTRGSTAWDGSADILLRLTKPDGNHRDTVRQLDAVGRFDMPPRLLIEWTKESGYVQLGTSAQIQHEQAISAALDYLPSSPLNAIELPRLQELTEVSRTSLQRALDDLVLQERVAFVGAGRRSDPKRYYRVPETRPDPFAFDREEE